MLNYIWAGLIIFSLVFALVYDFGDLARDTYRNDQALPVELAFPEGYDPAARRVPVEIRLDADAYGAFYATEERPADAYAGYLRQTREGTTLRFDAGAALPEPLATISEVSQSRDEELQGTLVGFTPPEPPPEPPAREGGSPSLDAAPVPPDEPAPAGDATTPADVTAPLAAPTPAQEAQAPVAEAAVRFERVRFVKMNAIAAAALDFAETAAEIALGLIGVLALFLGLLKIGEEAGI
ncbi:MAG: hypothetical protein R3362_09280, partial [Rhodothermales bacterium]|nr:hypothetical protein [Rhodothermales bacterium]